MLQYITLSLVLVISIQARSPLKPIVECGPVCMIACPFGNVVDERGCPTCECIPEPKPVCGPLCKMYCPFGNVKDEYGCPICKCNPEPIPKPCPMMKCAYICPGGYRKDMYGCQTCDCLILPTPPVKRTCPRLARANITCPLKNIDECTSDSECPGVQKCCIFGCIKKCL